MSLRRIAFPVTLLLASACAVGIEDEVDENAASNRPVVPFHQISGDGEGPARSVDVRTTLDEGPAMQNVRTVALWDFEPASADCNGWSATGATSIRAVPSHTGAYACKLCADGSTEEMRLTRRVAGVPRGSWVVSAWLRRHDRSLADVAARVTLDEATERAGIPSSILLIDEWKLLSAPLAVPVDVASVMISVVASAGRGDCILVDDVVIESAAAGAAHTGRPATPPSFRGTP